MRANRVAALERRLEELSGEQASTALTIESLQRQLEIANADYDRAVAQADAAEAVRVLEERSVTAASEARHGLSSRVDAFLDALAGARAEAGVELLFGMQGVLGTLLELVDVDDSIGLAFEAAVEQALSAVVVSGVPDARAAIAHLRAIGRSASLLVPPSSPVTTLPSAPGAERLRDAVRTEDADVARLLDQLLANVWLVRRWPRSGARGLGACAVRDVVTLDGDRFSPAGWRIGAPRSGATASALEAARSQLATATSRFEAAQAELIEAAAASELAVAHGSRLRRRGVRCRDDSRHSNSHSPNSPRRSRCCRANLTRRGANSETRWPTWMRRLPCSPTPSRICASSSTKRRSSSNSARSAVARRRELDERARELQQRRRDQDVLAATLAERRSLLAAREIELRTELVERAATFAEAASKRSSFVAEIETLARLIALVQTMLVGLEARSAKLDAEHRRRQSALAAHLANLTQLRGEKEQLERESALVAERRQRLEIERTESRVRYEAAVEALRHELDLTPEELLAIPSPSSRSAWIPRRVADKWSDELRELGPVNLLAQEELVALTERNTFLESQLEDIRSTRRELNQVIRAVDQEIVSVFTEAFADVAAELRAPHRRRSSQAARAASA